MDFLFFTNPPQPDTMHLYASNNALPRELTGLVTLDNIRRRNFNQQVAPTLRQQVIDDDIPDAFRQMNVHVLRRDKFVDVIDSVVDRITEDPRKQGRLPMLQNLNQSKLDILHKKRASNDPPTPTRSISVIARVRRGQAILHTPENNNIDVSPKCVRSVVIPSQVGVFSSEEFSNTVDRLETVSAAEAVERAAKNLRSPPSTGTPKLVKHLSVN